MTESRKDSESKRLVAHPGAIASVPRWVKVFGIVAVVLLALFAVLHARGGGFGRHG
ncbi:MAG TPA: hypothetical protein VG937_00210 [Polyangiaceae bacterium]|nr:hypothetical protein [Polyangiaceae bacterium]